MSQGIAWSDAFDAQQLHAVTPLPLPGPAAKWAWGGATGRGVKVAIVDSGIEADHPGVGVLNRSVTVETDDEGEPQVVDAEPVDFVGHGTACAGIIRSLAPEVELTSIRVLGANLKGRGSSFLAGVRWAVTNGMQVVNMSLSSKSETFFGPLHDVADLAYFHNVMLVCAANNVPGPTYPSQFASVFSVAARVGVDPYEIACNPNPPVEFGAVGIDVDVAWQNGGRMITSGNSFAAPHIAGLVALILSKHPGLTPFEVKSVLQAASLNADG